MTFETESRLKSYLDGNQPAREGLCRAVLALDKRFSDVRGRQPRGGPDGGRDIDATFQSTRLARAGVGFVNGANDTAPQKRQIKNKFMADLEAALREPPAPVVFIFFTNVALTSGEIDELKRHAMSRSIEYCDIYDRARITIALSGADGFAARFQFLQIPLSEPEQATFFARWGDDIQQLISSGFSRIEQTLARLQFLHEAGMELDFLAVHIVLNREYSGDEIGHFRAFFELYLKGIAKGTVAMLFGTADRARRGHAKSVEEVAAESPGIKHGMCMGQWRQRVSDDEIREFLQSTPREDEPDEEAAEWKGSGQGSSIGADPVRRIVISFRTSRLFRFEPEPRLIDLEECMFVLLCSAKLAEKIESIQVYANEYQLASISAGEFKIDTGEIRTDVPMMFTEAELEEPWVLIRPADFSSGFQLCFSERTPVRTFESSHLERYCGPSAPNE